MMVRSDAAGPITRYRFDLRARVSETFRVKFQANETRVGGRLLDADIREAYVEWVPSSSWVIKAGRQEIAFGDERLIGADTRWNPIAPAFDAASIHWSRNHWSAGWMEAVPVEVRPTQLNRSRPSELLTIANVTWQGEHETAEGYWLTAKPESDRRSTLGFRMTGALGGLQYNWEAARQTGGARAGHLDVSKSWESARWQPRVWWEYNFASGGSRLFHDLYPAAYNSFGLQDPFPWRDSRFSGIGTETAKGRLRLSGTYRKHWRDSTGVGLGHQWIAAAEHQLTRRLTIAGGLEGFKAAGSHTCELHARPQAHPFIALLARY
jgi:hypothetical protein